MEVGKAMYANDAVPAWLIFDDTFRKRYPWARGLPTLRKQYQQQQNQPKRQAEQQHLAVTLDDVRVDSLVPRCLTVGPFSPQFFTGYAAYDTDMAQRLERARARGAVLRYVGTLERGRACANIREFPRDHRFATTTGSDNLIAFTTNRYAHTPLVVQGPGAGADVTAMGVFSDIFKLLHYLPQ